MTTGYNQEALKTEVQHSRYHTNLASSASDISLTGRNSLEKISRQVKEKHENHQEKSTEISSETLEEFIPVNAEKFFLAWQDYVENEISRHQLNLSIILKKNPPEVNPDGSVKFIFPNSALLDMFNKERFKLADFLSEKYQIRGVKILTEIQEVNEMQKAVYLTNPREIYEFMAKKQPELIRLTNALRLKPD